MQCSDQMTSSLCDLELTWVTMKHGLCIVTKFACDPSFMKTHQAADTKCVRQVDRQTTEKRALCVHQLTQEKIAMFYLCFFKSLFQIKQLRSLKMFLWTTNWQFLPWLKHLLSNAIVRDNIKHQCLSQYLLTKRYKSYCQKTLTVDRSFVAANKKINTLYACRNTVQWEK